MEKAAAETGKAKGMWMGFLISYKGLNVLSVSASSRAESRPFTTKGRVK